MICTTVMTSFMYAATICLMKKALGLGGDANTAHWLQ